MSFKTFQACIDACLACGVECNTCASACLNEPDVTMMARCIELDRECALICFTAAQLMSMDGEFSHALCQLCADICETCAEECDKHDADHCKRCARVCRLCAEECRKMAKAGLI